MWFFTKSHFLGNWSIVATTAIIITATMTTITHVAVMITINFYYKNKLK